MDLPYALPGIIFALSLILVWLPSPLSGLTLYRTLWLILIAYLGRFLAFALQPIQAARRSLDTSLEEAASIDGADMIQSFRYVLLPLLTPALVAAMLLFFLQSFAELTLSALLVGSGTETLGWLVFGLQQGGYTHQAATLSTLLVLTSFAVAAGIQWIRPNSMN
ncbi:MAG: ABC transporter permease subunit [Cyanobacteriota bacterium]